MANVVYHRFLERALSGNLDFNDPATVCKAALATVAGTSYVAAKTHNYFGDLAGLGWNQLTTVLAPTYVQQTLVNKTVTLDAANDRVELSFDTILFGNLASGPVIRSIVIYHEVGGPGTPNDDPLICHIDTASGLPATLGGGPFSVTLNVEGLIWVRQP